MDSEENRRDSNGGVAMAGSRRLLSDRHLPLLVTGVAGVPGFNALPYFRDRHPGQVVGIRRAANWRLTGTGIEAIDIEDRAGLTQLFERYRFRSVLHFAGSCALKACELDPAMAQRVNVDGTRHLLELARRFESRVVQLSCDLVYSGTGKGSHAEEDPPDPVTVYGKTMVAAEELARTICPGSLVLRISLPMGPSFNGHAGAIDWIASRFRKSRPATLYFDEVRTPTYTDDMNLAFERLLVRDDAGLLHFGGPRKLSLYQIGQIVNRVGNFEPNLLKGCPRADAGPIPPRAGDVTLDSSKIARLLGGSPFRPWPACESLVPRQRDWHAVRGERENNEIERLLYRAGSALRS
ncbi:SDR family oxidoreductase [Kolteria novifilia]